MRFARNDNEIFGLIFNDGSGNPPIHETDIVPGSEEAIFLSDKFTVTSWLTLIAGVRATHFSSVVTENTTYPRLGGTLRIPHLNWVFRAFWGTLLSAAAARHAFGPAAQLSRWPVDARFSDFVCASARRARRRASVRRHDSHPRLGARHRQFRNARR